jgi:hypothetical protein
MKVPFLKVRISGSPEAKIAVHREKSHGAFGIIYFVGMATCG